MVTAAGAASASSRIASMMVKGAADALKRRLVGVGRLLASVAVAAVMMSQ